MKQIRAKTYPLDSSAIVHLTAMREKYTNTFRMSVTLSEKVCPNTLQNALDHVAPRFPTIVAGICRAAFRYEVIPAETAPLVRPDREILAYMPEDMIRTCAMRVLYSEKKISAEIFHSLTDGYGGLVFMKALLTEYLFLRHCISAESAEQNWPLKEIPQKRKLADDFITYAGNGAAMINHRKVYRLPGSCPDEQMVHITTGILDLQEMLDLSHRFHVSLTVFLTAVMAASIVNMQTEDRTVQEYEPIQIMVPVNLRKKFRSFSVRNFSLYALPCIEPSEFSMPFELLLEHISEQLEQQFSEEHLSRMISSAVRLQNMPLVRCIPLGIKESILRISYHYCGERNSCLTLSNMGEITFPDEFKPYIEQAEFMLSPRRNAPYNCAMTSYNGKLYINFSRRSEKPGLEPLFFRYLKDLGAHVILGDTGRQF